MDVRTNSVHARTTFIIGLALLVTGGCDALGDSSGPEWFSNQASSSAQTEVLEVAEGKVDDKQLAAVIEGFEKNWKVLLQRNDITDRIEQIESVFMRTGKYLELIEYYKRGVESFGYGNIAAQRLAWGYIQLQQKMLAERLIERLIERRPGDPAVWFLRGAQYMNSVNSGATAAASKLVASWERALELDPSFQGFGRIDSQKMVRQLDQLRQRLDSETLEAARSKITELAGGQTDSAREPTQQRRGRKDDSPGFDSADQVASRPTEESAAESAEFSDQKDSGVRGGGKEGPDMASRLGEASMAVVDGEYESARKIYREVLDKAAGDKDNEGAELRLRAQLGLIRIKARLGETGQKFEQLVERALDSGAVSRPDIRELRKLTGSKLDDSQLQQRLNKRLEEIRESN